MYFSRIVFFCEKGLTFENLSSDKIELFKYNDYKCTVKSKVQNEKTKVIIEYGGFKTKEEAQREGGNLLRNIKLEMCKHNNPINISGVDGILDCKEPSVKNGEITEAGLAFLKQKFVDNGIISENQNVMQDALGLEIYEVISSMDEILFVDQTIEIKKNTNFEIKRYNFEFWNNKLDIALSFLNTSNLINDIRIRFLLKIMAIEVLVSDKEYNDKNYLDIINHITKDINCTNELMAKIKNDISQLKVKSIGKKCKKLIETHCKEMSYSELDSLKFFNICYKMRSQLVHSGQIDLSELEKYDEPLKILVIDIIESISRKN